MLFNEVNIMLANFLRLLSGMLSVRFLALKSAPMYAQIREHIFLKCLSVEIGIRRTCKFGSPRIMRNYSTLQSSAGLKCTHVPESRLSYTKMDL